MPTTTTNLITDASQIPLADHQGRREWEIFDRVTHFDPNERSAEGYQVAQIRAYWSDDAPWKVTTGRVNSTQWFVREVRADGTARWGEPFRGKPTLISEYNARQHCRECDTWAELDEDGKPVKLFDLKQLAYGDLTTCLHCGHENYHSIGD